MKNSQKGFAIPLTIAIIAVLAIGGGMYFYNQNKYQQTNQQLVKNNQATSTSNTQTTSTSNQIINLKTYTNTQYGFNVGYPSDWNVVESKTSIGNNVTLSKSGYKLNISVSKLNLTGEGIVTEQDAIKVYTFLSPVAGKQTWRDTTPHLPEEPVGGIYGFDILFPKINTGSSGAVYKYQYSMFLNNGDTAYSFDYSLPKGTTNTNYDKNIIKEMDQIISTFKFTVTAPIINTSKAINISSPKSGDILKVGSTYQIAWNTSNIPVDSVGYIILKNNVEGGDLYVINRSVVLNGGSLSNFGGTRSWTIPSSLLIPTGNKYTIRIGIGSYDNDYYHGGKYFDSDMFTINNIVAPQSNLNLQTYSNSRYGFSVQYQNDFLVKENDTGSDFGSQTVPVSFTYPASYTTGTNLDSAKVFVGALPSCVSFTGMMGNVSVGSYTSNGNVFSVTNASDAAMGGARGNYTFYTISKHNTCYVVEKQIRYHDISFLQTEGVTNLPKAYDQVAIDSMFLKMLDTFKVQ